MAKISKKLPEPTSLPMNNTLFNNALIPFYLVKVIAERAYKGGYEGDLDSKEQDCLQIIQEVLEEAGPNSVAILSTNPQAQPERPNRITKEMKEMLDQMIQPPQPQDAAIWEPPPA